MRRELEIQERHRGVGRAEQRGRQARRWRGRRRRTASVSLLEALHLDAEGDFVLGLGDFGEGHEPVHEFLAHDLLDDVLVVVIAQSTREFVVVHIVLVLAQAPKTRHLLGVDQLELALVRRPRDDVTVLIGNQQLEQKLPQRDVRFHA